jgi:hypothetical protein
MQQPSQTYEFTVGYEPRMAGQAAALYWRKQHFTDLLIALACLAFAAILLLAGHVDRWIAYLLLSAALLLLALQLAVYLVQRRRSLAIIETLEVRGTTWRLSGEAFEVGNQWGQARLKWPLVAELLAGRDLWLLLMRDGGYMTLPHAGVPTAALDFLRQQVVAHGGRLR